MKVLAFSDTHLGHPNWKGFGEIVFDRAMRLAKASPMDVVLFCGDLIEPGNPTVTLEDGLKMLASIPAKHHLMVAGNNDIEALNLVNTLDYAGVLASKASAYGIKVLDEAPVTVGHVSFAGNFGGYDLSLWQPPAQPDPEYPSTYEELVSRVNAAHAKKVGCSYGELFQTCQMALWRHMQTLSIGSTKIVMATHTVAMPEFVLYGKSPQYDYQNAWMGWDDSKAPVSLLRTPGLVHYLCGHTHRAAFVDGKVQKRNISGGDTPYILEV